MTCLISDIQHFSVGDGDGIRTTVFFKGCHLHCPWCHNPETLSFEPQILRDAHGERLCGRLMSVEEIVQEILEDLDFYRASGGGVTLSGGEAMLQPEGVRDLARALRAVPLPVLVDTAGDVPYSKFEMVNPYVEEYYYDWKATVEDYGRVIGGDGRRILENLTRLIRDGKTVHARIPLIPGFNVSPAYSRRLCQDLKTAGVQKVDLLPFHRLGSGKYAALGLSYAYRTIPPMSKEQAEKITRIYREEFEVRIE